MPASSAFSIAVLISGKGSNLQALIDAIKMQTLTASIAVVISNKADAKGLERARLSGIPTVVIDHTGHASRDTFDQALLTALAPYQPDLVVLAGFMRILSAHFIHALQGKLINIHPSLLPLYKGTRTHQRALQDHALTHGCSVHFVTEELDGGPVIAQTEIAVLPEDTEETLAARVQKEEHQLYPLCIQWIINKKITLRNGKLFLADHTPLPPSGLKFRRSDYTHYALE